MTAQGSQIVGMGAGIAMAKGKARAAWDEGGALRFEWLALQDVVFPPPAFTDEAKRAQEDGLRATEWAQPAIGVASLAAFRVVDSLGLAPRCHIGHSFGELSALCAAGVF